MTVIHQGSTSGAAPRQASSVYAIDPIGRSPKQHQKQMQQLGLYDPYGLVFLTPNTHSNVYDHLLARVWCRSLKRCGLQPRRLYAQRHTFLSHALAMGNSPADLAAAAGHSTKMLLETYAKPTGRLQMPSWAVSGSKQQQKLKTKRWLRQIYKTGCISKQQTPEIAIKTSISLLSLRSCSAKQSIYQQINTKSPAK